MVGALGSVGQSTSDLNEDRLSRVRIGCVRLSSTVQKYLRTGIAVFDVVVLSGKYVLQDDAMQEPALCIYLRSLASVSSDTALVTHFSGGNELNFGPIDMLQPISRPPLCLHRRHLRCELAWTL